MNLGGSLDYLTVEGRLDSQASHPHFALPLLCSFCRLPEHMTSTNLYGYPSVVSLLRTALMCIAYRLPCREERLTSNYLVSPVEGVTYQRHCTKKFTKIPLICAAAFFADFGAAVIIIIQECARANLGLSVSSKVGSIVDRHPRCAELKVTAIYPELHSPYRCLARLHPEHRR